MSAATIAVLEPGYRDYETETAIFAPLGAKVVPVAADEDTLTAVGALDPAGILVRERLVTAEAMDKAPSLKVIARYGIGVDNIDLEAAKARGIKVANVPGYGAEHEVSDHALALYLTLQRRLVARDRALRDGAWGIGQAEPIPGRLGATVGLVGYGRIGAMAAKKFRVFGFELFLVVDPHRDPDALIVDGLEPVDLDTLCAEADVISLHLPLTDETRGMIDARRIGLMKPSAIVVNVSRGGLVDEDALAAALHEGRLFGAGLDVFAQEPPDRSHPLFSAPRTVFSDHAAWYSERSVEALQSGAAQEVARVLKGEDPLNWVNR